MNRFVPFRPESERRILPHNYEAEQALLGAVLTQNAVLPMLTGLRPEDFADAVHGRIFAAAAKLIDSGAIANALTLGNHFDADGALSSVGGAAYLARLQNSVVTIIGAEDYARTIRDLADRRRIIEACEQRIDEAYDVDLDRPAASIAADLSGQLTAAIAGEDDGFVGIADLAERACENLARDLPCDPTGMPAIDEALAGGLFAEKLYGIGARMKAGKTLLMASMAHNMNLAGVPTLYVSLEMSPDQLTQRILARMMGINSLAFLNRGWRQAPKFIADAGAAAIAMRANANNLLFLQRRRMTLDSLRQTIARAVLTRKVRGVWLDYLQLVTGQRRGQSRAEFYDDVTQTLAETAIQYGIWIVAAAQLNQEDNVRFGEGLLMAADLSLKLHKVEMDGEPDRGWLEMPYSRYTPLHDIGSANFPALELDTRAGPFFIDISRRYEPAPQPDLLGPI